ncbi:hypothetical protein Trihar35433_8464 [Trichoderma harzianum]|nr:hypothetical protein Trihar35433_8464 [Trichoderma harzianum]
MASRHVDIDPDGDTLIILPRITAEGDEKNEPSQVTFKTSMKHLTLASIRAKKKFDPMFDPDAFEIVLRIVHAQLHKLPKELSLTTMTQVAIIADDLQCSDPVAHFAQQWGSNNDFWSASHSWLDLSRKIFICSVFKLKEWFSPLTQTAIIYSFNKVSSYGIPIPQQILQAIEERRAFLMKEQLKYLFTVERELQDETLCWECRAQNFGFLKFNLHLHQLPASESPELWATITCQVLKEKMRKFKYATRTGCTYKSGLKHPSFKKQITEALKVSNAGLDPASFLNTAAAAK